jgi:hypothetical protein
VPFNLPVLIRKRRPNLSPYSSEALTYFAAMSTPPSDARKALINTCINSLISAGVWAKLDWLSLFASHDAQAAMLNAVAPYQYMTAVSSPTFLTDRHYVGNGTSSYLNSGWNPLTAASPKFTQNNHSMGVWCRNDVNSFSQSELGHTTRATIISRNSSNATIYAASGSSNFALPVATSVGFTSYSKLNSTQVRGYKNGTAIATNTVTSSALYNQPFYALAASNSVGTAGSFSTRQIAALFWGSQLSDSEHQALYNAVNTYLVAVGAA